MGGAQALKRIPRIKFPQRHPKSTGLSIFHPRLFQPQRSLSGATCKLLGQFPCRNLIGCYFCRNFEGSQPQTTSKAGDSDLTFLSSSKAPATVGGKASLQPKRTPVSNEEIEAIMLGGCF